MVRGCQLRGHAHREGREDVLAHVKSAALGHGEGAGANRGGHLRGNEQQGRDGTFCDDVCLTACGGACLQRWS